MTSLIEHLSALKRNDTSKTEIKFFYERCFKIGLLTIQKRFTGERSVLIGSDLTFENLTNDAITPLFIKRKDNEPIGLIKSYNNWENPIETEEEAAFFLNKIIWNRIGQFMTKMLKNSDPFFNKIHTSIKYFAEKNGYNRITYFGVTYITPPGYNKITGSIIENEEVENLPGNLFFGKYQDVLLNIFNYIETKTDYFPAIPINSVVKRIKYLMGSDHYISFQQNNQPHFEDEMDINLMVKKSLEKIFKEIEQTDLRELGIKEDSKPAILLALKDISEDMKNGGVNWGVFHYFEFYLKDLKQEDFHKNYYRFIKTLLDKLKNNITDEIKFQKS